MTNLPIKKLQKCFPEILQENVKLSKFTACRIGGPADILLTASSADQLATIIISLNEMGLDYFIIGGGSNILISDKGFRGIVILNRAKSIKFNIKSEPPTVFAESGSNLIHMTKLTAERSLTGLEWAGGIPGTIGGAIHGNAGAHGGEIAGNLISAEVLLNNNKRVKWDSDKFGFEYRSSKLQENKVVVLSAYFKLAHGEKTEIMQEMKGYLSIRKRTQPPGASLGSIFRNPPEDYAGRLIDATGLKGIRIGDAEISPKHGNFFINHGRASCKDLTELVNFVQQKVLEKFGITLELEIKIVGEF